ncbi:MAG: peptidoglycan-binding domain-containing protein [Hyphomicrobiaceae bacterium]
MLRTLALLSAVTAIWGLSQVLPTTELPDDTAKTAQVMTRAVSIDEPRSLLSRSVALLDFAVTVLPRSVPEIDDAELQGTEPAAPVTTVSAVTSVEATPPSETEVPDAPVDQTVDGEDEKVMAALARSLQRELRRVGCLRSAVDGIWGKDSRRAMQSFAERIEADLPVDTPSSVLLMLVERFEDRACGVGCPSGTAPDAHGRCAPNEEMAAVQPASEDADRPEPEVAAASVSSDAGAATPTRKRAAVALPVRTTIAVLSTAKRPRKTIAARKTRWSVPKYGLGVPKSSTTSAVAKPGKKKRRLGASAAYRRWMKRSAISMR